MTRVVQYVADLQSGDAVSGIVRALDQAFRRWGCDAAIAAAGWGEDQRGAALPYQECGDADLHLYHFSVACSPLTAWFRRTRGRKALIYHNITPPEWFMGYDEAALWSTGLARSELAGLRDAAAVALSYSPYNVAELRALGFADVRAIPFPMDPARFGTAPDPATRQALESDAVHFLFVGRVAPNKCQEDVVKIFYHYHRHCNRDSRLHLVGPSSVPAYAERLQRLIDDLGLSENAKLVGRVSDAVLAAYYARAQAFVCMSEHEGFCVPLLEAMHHGVPVVAYAAAAVPDTVGQAGILVREKRADVVAEMIHALQQDTEARDRVVARQRQHLASFDAAAARSETRRVLTEAGLL